MIRLAVLLLGLAGAPALALPTHVEAQYEVARNGLVIGRVVESYVREGDTYSIESVTHAEGLAKVFTDDSLTVHSQGRVLATGLQPLRYEQRRRRDGKRDVTATFDWKEGTLLSEYRGESKQVALPPGTQDRLSILYQFMNVPAREATVEMYMSNGRKVERYTYRLAEESRVQTRAGAFETRRYERVLTEEGQSSAQLWLAKDHFNLPVRIVFDDKGVRLDQTLVALKTY